MHNSYEVDRLDVQTMGSKTFTKSSIDDALVYSHCQDGDDDASSACTTASSLSEHSFYSDLSQRSDSPLPSKPSSILPCTDIAPESKAEHEEGNATSVSGCQMGSQLAMDWSPSRQSRHRRTRSGTWSKSVQEAMPNQVPSEETGVGSLPIAAGKSGQCSMQAAYFSFWSSSFPTGPASLRRSQKSSRYDAPISLLPLAEEPIEEVEDEDEVPEEPVPMVPTGNSFTVSTCDNGYR